MLNQYVNYIIVSGVFIIWLATNFIVEAGTESDLSHKLLLQILSVEFPEIRLVDWDKGDNILTFSHDNETIMMSLYGPIEYDLDQEGNNEIIMGYEFLNRWETGSKYNDHDLLGIYTITEDGLPRRIFRQRFPPQDTGQFEDIHVEDVTGDGKPEINVRHRTAYAGARSWGWQDSFSIISGHHPFDILFELKVLDIAENVNGSEHSMKVEVEIEDINGDDANEIFLQRYEGRDEFTMKKVTLQPLIYRLIDGRYVLEHD